MKNLIEFINKISRFLDSCLILLAVSLLTFLIIRLDLNLKVLEIGLFIFTVLISFIVLFFEKIRNKLFYFGLGFSLFLFLMPLSHWFPSLAENNYGWGFIVWKFLISFIIYPVLIILYTVKSYVSKEKLLLSFLGFLLLISFSWQLGEKIKFINKLEIKLSQPIILKTGDPLADLRLNPSIHPEALKREEKRLGLKEPLFKQFLLWLDGIFVKFDFGLTQQGESVLKAIAQPLRNTLILNILVLFFTWLISIPLGVWAAIHKNKWTDSLILNFSSISLMTPAFLLAIFILAFALKIGFGKIGGLTSANFTELNIFQQFFDLISHLILPIIILTFISVGGLIRQMRANFLDTLNEDYIKSARARGISENSIFWNHALQNSINPLITLLGFEFASLVSGAALTEMILAYPGIGALTLEAARKLDINLIMFNLLLGTVMLMFGSFLSDYLLSRIDPRTK
jgi:peptide/nickel transport system permease protein